MVTENVNSRFFDGAYKEIWRAFIPNGLTIAENEYIPKECNLQEGSTVLDIMCGYGRNTLGLARKGIAVTAVDNCTDYINEIKITAAAEGLPVECLETDVLNFETDKKFDAAICLGNSFSFFNKEDTMALLAGTADKLKPGAKFIIQTMMLTEMAVKEFTETTEGTIGEYKCNTKSVFLFNPTRIEVLYTMIADDGTEETKDSIDYLYSYSEMTGMIQDAGFTILNIYSIPGRKPFAFGEPRAYFVAQKNS
jgi:2-polyprenyl-3-methyl-5-hydroxy-6-metoxy-1,4-benzoquinol methylase